MIILTIRTDNPEAEIGIFDSDKQLKYLKWPAHRQLSETIHLKIKDLLTSQKLELNNVEGLVIYKGPGSFTGLRIGFSLANSLSDALDIPIVSTTGSEWVTDGINRLLSDKNENLALPDYGAEPHITQPRK